MCWWTPVLDTSPENSWCPGRTPTHWQARLVYFPEKATEVMSFPWWNLEQDVDFNFLKTFPFPWFKKKKVTRCFIGATTGWPVPVWPGESSHSAPRESTGQQGQQQDTAASFRPYTSWVLLYFQASLWVHRTFQISMQRKVSKETQPPRWESGGHKNLVQLPQAQVDFLASGSSLEKLLIRTGGPWNALLCCQMSNNQFSHREKSPDL